MTLKAAALVAFALVAAGAAEALPPAKTMYTDALAREQTLRAALSAPDASPGVLEEGRAEIAAYEATPPAATATTRSGRRGASRSMRSRASDRRSIATRASDCCDDWRPAIRRAASSRRCRRSLRA